MEMFVIAVRYQGDKRYRYLNSNRAGSAFGARNQHTECFETREDAERRLQAVSIPRFVAVAEQPFVMQI